MREEMMSRSGCSSISVGELVTAVFDNVAQYSTDPRQVSNMAAQVVGYLLRHAKQSSADAPLWPPSKMKTRLHSAYTENRPQT
jgi:hypothetical protein